MKQRLKKFTFQFLALSLSTIMLAACSTQVVSQSSSPTQTLVPTQSITSTPAATIKTVSAPPFTVKDSLTISNNMKTVGDYVNATHPVSYEWYTRWEDLSLLLKLNCNGGNVTLALRNDEYEEIFEINESYAGNAIQISAADLKKEAKFYTASWQSSDFTSLNTVRDIHIGDTKEKVLDSFLRLNTGEPDVLYTVNALNPEADDSWISAYQYFIGGCIEPRDYSLGFEYTECITYVYSDVKKMEESRSYNSIRFFIQDDKVIRMDYDYYTDMWYMENTTSAATEQMLTPAPTIISTPAASISMTPAATIKTVKAPPFTFRDPRVIWKNMDTIGDFVNATHPVSYEWVTWEANGELVLTMNCIGGNVALSFYEDDYSKVPTINGKEEGKAKKISAADLKKEAGLYSVSWQSAGFTGLNTVRNIHIGDTKEKVLNSFLRLDTGDPNLLYPISVFNPLADESWDDGESFIGGNIVPKDDYYDFNYDECIRYVYSHVQEKEEWRTYWGIRYFIKDGKVIRIDYDFFTDPE